MSEANHTTPTVSAIRAAPLNTRVIALAAHIRLPTADSGLTTDDCRLTTLSLGAERHGRRLDAAVASIALLVGEHRLQEIAAAEVGPQRFGHPDFSVGDLPKQKIADAHLAAGA